MKHPHRRRFLRSVAFILLIVLALWSLPEHVTLSPSENVPTNAQPDLPWNLTLVNRESGVPEGYHFTLAHARDGAMVDRRIVHDLTRMLDDAEALGYEVHLNAGYRTSSEQSQLFADKTAAFRASGYDEQTAASLAAQWVSPPGTSEHELGIAVDIGTATPALYDWLAEESWRYGFIQRYPYKKTGLTGVSHEPWHYRYVGEKAASAMYAQDLCLEEYVQGLSDQACCIV